MKNNTIPLTKKDLLQDGLVIIWDGYSQAFRFKDGSYHRDESYDYIFTVRQLRQDNVWKSIKSLHRIHPSYDGKAGDREQTMYFELHFYKADNNIIKSKITSSLGLGTGETDTEFKNQTLKIDLQSAKGFFGRFMPYNQISINQNYNYAEGKLNEEVLLNKNSNETVVPFMKNIETAIIYKKGTFNNPPTIFKHAK